MACARSIFAMSNLRLRAEWFCGLANYGINRIYAVLETFNYVPHTVQWLPGVGHSSVG